MSFSASNMEFSGLLSIPLGNSAVSIIFILTERRLYNKIVAGLARHRVFGEANL
jgi:hypothetical protein